MWSRHRVLAGVGMHPGRSHRCVAVNPPHDHPEFKQFRVSSYSLKAAQRGPHNPGAEQKRGTNTGGKNRRHKKDVITSRMSSSYGHHGGGPGSTEGQSKDHQRSQRRVVGLLPRLHGAAALSMVMGQHGFL